MALKIALILYFLWEAPSQRTVEVFVRSVFSINFFHALIYEPLALIIFSIIFSAAGPNSKCTRFAGAVLLGNCHRNLIYSVVYDLNN